MALQSLLIFYRPTELKESPALIAWSLEKYGEDWVKNRIQEVQKDPDIAIISQFSKIFNTWPPRYHTFYLDYLLHPDEDEFWLERSAKEIYDKAKVPVYLKCGWAPLGRWSAPVFNAMNSKELDTYKRCGVMESYGGMELPYRFMNEEMLRWYDQWMKGVDTGIQDEPIMKLNIIGRGYRYENEWPLARTNWRKLYLHTFNELRWNKDPEGNLPPDSFTYRPPNITTEVETLTYKSARIGKPMEFTGPMELHLFAAIDAEDANFLVKLWQITPGGTRMPLCRTGSLRASYPLDEKKSLLARPAHDYSKKVPVTPGEIREYVIEINPIGMVFGSGTAIELGIKAMDSFEYQDKACEGKIPHMRFIPSSKTINYKIYRDNDYPSYIVMPEIPFSPGEQWIRSIVGGGEFAGSGKGATH